MKHHRTYAVMVVAVGILVLGACTVVDSGSTPMNVFDTKLGKVLADSKGMTLYVFDKDTAGTSKCMEKCIVAWPPLLADVGDKAWGIFSVIERADGTRQWAYDNKPLYRWSKDKKPGDVTGHGVRDGWHIVRLVETFIDAPGWRARWRRRIYP